MSTRQQSLISNNGTKKQDQNESKQEHMSVMDRKFAMMNSSLRQRKSFGQTAIIPAYPKNARRLSKSEMQEMKHEIDKTQEAIIKDPKAAANQYSTASNPILENKGKYRKNKSVYTTIKPMIVVIIIVIIMIILYAFTNAA